jgi:hypothetical protein
MKFSRILIGLLIAVGFVSFCWSAEETKYLEAGIPSFDHVWLGDDYERAADVLSSARVDLPVYSEPAGRIFFKRVTALENLSFFRSNTIPLDYRTENYVKVLRSLDTFLLLYIMAAGKGMSAHRETAEITGYMVYLTPSGVELTDKLLATLARDDQYAARMEAINNIRDSAATIFAGAAGSLAKTDFYSAEDLSLIIKAMITVLPDVRKTFPANYRRDLRVQLSNQKDHFSGSDLQNLEKMLDLLRLNN